MQRNTQGYTLVEVLVITAVIAIMAGITFVTFNRFNQTASLKTAGQEVQGALIDARQGTVASDGDTVFGVHITGTGVVRFPGSTYVAGGPDNVTYTFTGGVTAVPTLSGGTADVVFTRVTGQPSATGTIVLSDLDGIATRTVTVYGSGLIDYE